MVIGQRLKEIRESKNLSQGDIEKRTGLLCCYTSRVEGGHTVPSVETLERYARAFEIPLYRLFYEGDEPIKLSRLIIPEDGLWGARGKERAELRLFAKALSQMSEHHRKLLFIVATVMAGRRKTD